jgi:hypothetical protein
VCAEISRSVRLSAAVGDYKYSSAESTRVAAAAGVPALDAKSPFVNL